MARGSFIDRLVRRAFYKAYARNILYELQLRARSEAADYVRDHMPDALVFNDNAAILRHCLETAPQEGAVLEFGVAGGTSIRVIAGCTPRTVHGFDSFEGLPEDWAGHLETRGAFSQKGQIPKAPANVVFHKGWFDQTLATWLKDDPSPVAFIHIDCDIYSSTREVLWALRPRIGAGTVIKFDEYFNYPNWRAHEFKAWQEFVAEFGVEYRYLAFTARDGSVAVQVTRMAGATGA